MLLSIPQPSIGRCQISYDAKSRAVERRASIVDRVELAPYDSLTIHTDDAGTFAGSRLSMRIEEPAPGMLFVRFIYELTGLATDRSDDEDAARCNAYQQSDVQRVRQARRFAATQTLQ